MAYDERSASEAAVKLLFGSLRAAMTEGTTFDAEFRKRLLTFPAGEIPQRIFDVAVMAANTIRGHCDVVGGDSPTARMYQLREHELNWQFGHEADGAHDA